MTVNYSTSFNEHLAQVSAWAPEKWVSLKSDALSAFAKKGFPPPTDEMWRKTDLSIVRKKAFPPILEEDADQDSVFSLVPESLKVGTGLVFVNGRLSPTLSYGLKKISGVEILSLPQALRSGNLKENDWQNLPSWGMEHPFVGLNMAYHSDGAYVRIGSKIKTEEPIFLFCLHSKTQGAYSSFTRNLLILEAGSQANVIEVHAGADQADYLVAPVTDIVLEANAVLDYTKIQLEGDAGYHFGTTVVRQARDSQLRSFSFSMGGLNVRNDLNTNLTAEGANCVLNGLFVGHRDQRVNNYTTIDHAKPHCSSQQLYKGILDGKSRAVFNGRVIVRPDAQKTDANQLNKNLILSGDALIDTIPQLEIFADDVKCSHGATTGKLDEKELFYLRTRGIDLENAKRILLNGFVQEILDSVAIPELQKYVQSRLFDQTDLR